MALAIAPVVRALVWILSPITWAIHMIVRLLLKIVGVDYHAEDAFGSAEEELRGAIELHGADEETTDEERAMLHSILDLDNVEVGEIMTHRKNVAMIDGATPADQIVSQVLESPYTRLPVYEDDPDNIVGIIHAKALLRAVRAERQGEEAPLDVADLAAEPWFVPETTTLLDQLQAFRARHEHFALVVDEYGSLLGIVTLEDILEEIVGDITDEHDRPVTGVRREAGGTFLVQGTVTIRDLNRKFDWNLPDEEAATVAGLVLYEARRIPEVGQAFRFHGCTFEIVRRQRHQITAIRITPPETARPAQASGATTADADTPPEARTDA
jgi:Mg2+/Co2+ transporter CorB